MTTPILESTLSALHASGPAADRAGDVDLYGWLIGSWDIDVIEFRPDGTTRRRPGEWHFGRVLEGRAIQDVWLVPPRRERRGLDPLAEGAYYGTTLRVYDPAIDAWRIQWTEPVSQTYLTMIGRKQGDDIVQLGDHPDGGLVCWSFTDITPSSFRWRGETSTDGGTSWRPHMEFTATRSEGPDGKAG